MKTKKKNYKIGDKVLIKNREGDADEYPFCFAYDMLEYCGKVATITDIRNADFEFNNYDECTYYNGDVHLYRLDIDAGEFSWHSSMFDSVGESTLATSVESVKHTHHHKVYKDNDIVSCCGDFGVITRGSIGYYLCMNIDNEYQDHGIGCDILTKKLGIVTLGELVSEAGLTSGSGYFPEFKTIEELMKFVDYLNSRYYKTTLSTTKTLESHEIKFQRPKASSKRGVVPTGSRVCGRKDKITVAVGHLSYQVCNC